MCRHRFAAMIVGVAQAQDPASSSSAKQGTSTIATPLLFTCRLRFLEEVHEDDDHDDDEDEMMMMMMMILSFPSSLLFFSSLCFAFQSRIGRCRLSSSSPSSPLVCFHPVIHTSIPFPRCFSVLCLLVLLFPRLVEDWEVSLGILFFLISTVFVSIQSLIHPSLHSFFSFLLFCCSAFVLSLSFSFFSSSLV